MKKIDEADLIIEDDLGYSIYKNFFKDQVRALIATCSIEYTLFCIVLYTIFYPSCSCEKRLVPKDTVTRGNF